MPRGVKGSGPGAAAKAGGGSVLATLRYARAQLISEQSGIQRKLAALDATIAAFGGALSSGGAAAAPQRAGGASKAKYRRGSLKERLHQIMTAAGKSMAVKDVHQAVKQSGYKSDNKTLAKSIGIALSQMSTIKKVSRGVFRAK